MYKQKKGKNAQKQLDCKQIDANNVLQMRNCKLFKFRKQEIYPSIRPPVSKCDPNETAAMLAASMEVNGCEGFDPKQYREYSLSESNLNTLRPCNMQESKKNPAHIVFDWSKMTANDLKQMENCKTFDFQKAERYANIKPPISRCDPKWIAEWLANTVEHKESRRLFDMETDDILDVWRTSPNKDTLGFYGVGSSIQRPEAVEFNQLISKCLEEVRGHRTALQADKPITKSTAIRNSCVKSTAKSSEILLLNRSLLESRITKMPTVQKKLHPNAALGWLHCPRRATSEPFVEHGLCDMEKPMGKVKQESKKKQKHKYCEMICGNLENEENSASFKRELKELELEIEGEPKNYDELYTQLVSCFGKVMEQDPILRSYYKCCQRSSKQEEAGDKGGGRVAGDKGDGRAADGKGDRDRFGDGLGNEGRPSGADAEYKGRASGADGFGMEKSGKRTNESVGVGFKTVEYGAGEDGAKVGGLGSSTAHKLQAGVSGTGINTPTTKGSKTADGKKKPKAEKDTAFTTEKVDKKIKKQTKLVGKQSKSSKDQKMKPLTTDKEDTTNKHLKKYISSSLFADNEEVVSKTILNVEDGSDKIDKSDDLKDSIASGFWKKPKGKLSIVGDKEKHHKRRGAIFKYRAFVEKYKKTKFKFEKDAVSAASKPTQECPCEICEFMNRPTREPDPPFILEMLKEQKAQKVIEYRRQLCHKAYKMWRDSSLTAPQHKCDAIECDKQFHLNPKVGDYFDRLTALKKLQQLLCDNLDEVDYCVLNRVQDLRDRLWCRLNPLL